MISKDSPPSNNIEIAGYNEFEFELTGTIHGNAGFYIKSGLDYRVRDDLALNSPGNFEVMFVEIILSDRNKLAQL